MDFPKSININNYMELNQKKFTLNNDNKFYNGGNIFHEYIPKHKLINLTKKENFIPENGCFPENTNTNTNPNNSFIPNIIIPSIFNQIMSVTPIIIIFPIIILIQ